MQGLRIIKGIGGEAAARDRYRAASREARDATITTIGGVALVEALQVALMGLLVAGVTIGAGLRLLAGQITIGELIAAVGLATFLAEPVGMMIMISAMAARSSAAATRIVGFTSTEPLLPDGPLHAASNALPLRISGLSGPGVMNLDLTVRPGENVAVVVPDPVAAHTVTAALAGEGDYGGTIEVFGAPRGELALDSAHANLLVAPHHVDLFEGTIASNVTLSDDELSPGLDLSAALEAAAASELVGLFPDGLEHSVDAAGTNLSGGQRQRIALARALAADAPLLILDDPTTAVDAVTEQHIARSVRAVRDGRATVVITASPAFLAAADRVVHVGAIRVGAEDGRR